MTEAQRISSVAAYIEQHLDGDVSLGRLSRETGVSRFHLQRSFKRTVGLTPKQYAEACRLQLLKRSLRTGPGVLDAVFEAGFGSPSRVYERADSRLGMTPREYRDGGVSAREGAIEITHATAGTALGPLMIGATDRGVCFVQFGESAEALEDALRREYPEARLGKAAEPWPAPLRAWINAVEEHLEGASQGLDLPLDVRATAFQMRVWRVLQSIPYGETRTYKQVAEAIGDPKSARAVAQACARNPAALAIPCHRVLRASGELAGYRWGLARKKELLNRERTACSADR